MIKVHNIWVSAFIVFVASACSLIIELVAGRIMAPYVGVSLYTWTSIIGVVLAGISLGNYLGGKIADRWGSRRTLGILLFLAGLSSLEILGAMALLDAQPFNLTLLPKILFLSAAIFFPPSCILGTISPVIVKLTLENLKEAGNIVGKIYAFGALGSICGTFLTGFVLIAWLGTRTIVFIVALILVAMAVAFGEWRRSKVDLAVMLIMLAGFSGYAYSEVQGGALQSRYLKETNYYSIKVVDTPMSDNTLRKDLVLDHLIHSYTWIDDPKRLGYDYERIYAEITKYVALTKTAGLKTLFIGGGGYTFPRYVEAVYPGSHIDVVEIDPEVTSTAFQYLGLRRDTTIRTFNQDARLFFDDNIRADGSAAVKYDLVMGDAFNDLSVPYHLTTYEFDLKIRNSLEPDGYYMANVIDNARSGEFLRGFANTLKQAFAHVYIFGIGSAWNSNVASTYVVLAGNTPLNVAQLTASSTNDTGRPVGTMMTQDELRAFLQRGRQIIFTDDYAPVDNLVAPLFIERGL
ncbi:MAG: hypothetical protein EPO21_23400 [Chloroflexota bacterium]|nr:MAG: hypothetical protein EPO21_23400 [Chloroflexota bacterium]